MAGPASLSLVYADLTPCRTTGWPPPNLASEKKTTVLTPTSERAEASRATLGAGQGRSTSAPYVWALNYGSFAEQESSLPVDQKVTQSV